MDQPDSSKSARLKNVGLFAVIVILAVSTIFLWNELGTLTLSAKINDSKLTGYFTTLGVFAAGITIYLLYVQLDMLQEQLDEAKLTRESSRMPQLRPGRLNFGIKDVRNYPKESDTVSVYNLIDNGGVIWEDLKNPVLIDLHNVGLGIATSIEIAWIYNLDEVRAIIAGNYESIEYEQMEIDYHDFVPAEGILKINLPSYYLQCCGSKVNHSVLDNMDKIEIAEKPELKLSIKSNDIFGNEFYFNFLVIIEAYDDRVSFDFRPIKL